MKASNLTAFDSVHRGKMMEILHAYGVPDETINAINILYTNTMAQVLTPDGISIAITDTDFADDSIVKYFKTS